MEKGSELGVAGRGEIGAQKMSDTKLRLQMMRIWGAMNGQDYGL